MLSQVDASPVSKVTWQGCLSAVLCDCWIMFLGILSMKYSMCTPEKGPVAFVNNRSPPSLYHVLLRLLWDIN